MMSTIHNTPRAPRFHLKYGSPRYSHLFSPLDTVSLVQVPPHPQPPSLSLLHLVYFLHPSPVPTLFSPPIEILFVSSSISRPSALVLQEHLSHLIATDPGLIWIGSNMIASNDASWESEAERRSEDGEGNLSSIVWADDRLRRAVGDKVRYAVLYASAFSRSSDISESSAIGYKIKQTELTWNSF